MSTEQHFDPFWGIVEYQFCSSPIPSRVPCPQGNKADTFNISGVPDGQGALPSLWPVIDLGMGTWNLGQWHANRGFKFLGA